MKKAMYTIPLLCSLFSGWSLGSPSKDINCYASIVRGDEPENVIKGYLRIQLEPTLSARTKILLPDEVERISTNVESKNLSKEEVLTEPISMSVVNHLHIKTEEIKSAQLYTANDWYHGWMLYKFYGFNDQELGSGGIVDLRAFFSCQKSNWLFNSFHFLTSFGGTLQ